MRLGQLSKQLEVKPQVIVDLLKSELSVEVNNHPNIKIKDEWQPIIDAHFTNQNEENDEVVVAKNNVTEEVEVETIQEKSSENGELREFQRGEEVAAEIIENAETVEREKIVLDGPKIVNKIELPEPKVKSEDDGEVKETAEERQARLALKKKEQEAKRYKRYEEKKKKEEDRLAKAQKRKEKQKEKKIKDQKRAHYLNKIQQKPVSSKTKKKKEKPEIKHLTIEQALDKKGKLNQQNQYSDIWLIRIFQKLFA